MTTKTHNLLLKTERAEIELTSELRAALELICFNAETLGLFVDEFVLLLLEAPDVCPCCKSDSTYVDVANETAGIKH